MSNQLPERPNLDHLRKQAKDLLKAHRQGDPEAQRRLSNAKGAPALHDAQSAIAREYGFQSWTELVREVEKRNARQGITEEVVKRYVDAATSDHVDTLRRMLELYPDLPTHNPTTALVSAEHEYVKAWLTPDKVNERLAPKDWLPIEYVAHSRIHRLGEQQYKGQEDCARLLLDSGADPNTYHAWEGDPKARLPVLYGASGASGHLGITRLLLERGAHPDDGESVYHCAQFNRRDILEALLEHGADISGKDAHTKYQPDAHTWNNTPIFFLLGYRPTDPGLEQAVGGIEWLLEHGADPNVRCYEAQETALHAACRGGWGAGMIELLLRHGADPSLERTDGRTPYVLARVTGNHSAAEALRKAGAAHQLSEKDTFLAACADGDTQTALSHKHMLQELTNEEKMVFVKMAEYGVTDGVRTMLDAGFDPAFMGEFGTALHMASFTGRSDVVRLLLERGAPLHVKDCCYHATPLGWALHAVRYHRSPGVDYLGVIQALLSAGGSQEELQAFLDSEDAPPDIVDALK